MRIAREVRVPDCGSGNYRGWQLVDDENSLRLVDLLGRHVIFIVGWFAFGMALLWGIGIALLGIPLYYAILMTVLFAAIAVGLYFLVQRWRGLKTLAALDKTTGTVSLPRLGLELHYADIIAIRIEDRPLVIDGRPDTSFVVGLVVRKSNEHILYIFAESFVKQLASEVADAFSESLRKLAGSDDQNEELTSC